MSMARLIKKIALGSNVSHNAAGFRSFNSSSKHTSPTDKGSFKSWAAQQGASIKGIFREEKGPAPAFGGIQKTEEFTVRSAPGLDMELQLRKGEGDKGVQVAVSRVGVSEGKNTRAKMSDEETLIEERLAYRKSAESSAPPSEVSDVR